MSNLKSLDWIGLFRTLIVHLLRSLLAIRVSQSPGLWQAKGKKSTSFRHGEDFPNWESISWCSRGVNRNVARGLYFSLWLGHSRVKKITTYSCRDFFDVNSITCKLLEGTRVKNKEWLVLLSADIVSYFWSLESCQC